jgi:hypothetical protein
MEACVDLGGPIVNGRLVFFTQKKEIREFLSPGLEHLFQKSSSSQFKVTTPSSNMTVEGGPVGRHFGAR